jgi:SAM-dependent methyltransferase
MKRSAVAALNRRSSRRVVPPLSESLLAAKPDGYFDVVRHEVLPFIPEDVSTVLEVGCAGGAFGAQLKERGAREVWGVEIDESAARRAQRVLDRVLIGDIATLVDDLPDAYFDLVVFNDVLEHLVDPFTVLSKIRRSISPRGVVISSIPNIRYYPTFHDLLVHKKWEYQEWGILDSTHLRFFTVSSIRNMYIRLGYEVLKHEGISPMPEPPWKYCLGNLILRGRLDDMQFLQFVTVARPVATTPDLPERVSERHVTAGRSR